MHPRITHLFKVEIDAATIAGLAGTRQEVIFGNYFAARDDVDSLPMGIF